VTRRRREPDARQIIRFIADQESLALTCDEFPGITEEKIRQILRDFLGELDKSARPARQAEASAEAATSGAGVTKVELFVDGAARGNPGPAGAGWVVRNTDGATVKEGSAFLGRRSSNEAEYEAVIRGLQEASALGARDVAMRCDSEMLVRQINGQTRIRDERLEALHRSARDLIQSFRRFEARHIAREQNTLADSHANKAIEEGEPAKR